MCCWHADVSQAIMKCDARCQWESVQCTLNPTPRASLPALWVADPLFKITPELREVTNQHTYPDIPVSSPCRREGSPTTFRSAHSLRSRTSLAHSSAVSI